VSSQANEITIFLFHHPIYSYTRHKKWAIINTMFNICYPLQVATGSSYITQSLNVNFRNDTFILQNVLMYIARSVFITF